MTELVALAVPDTTHLFAPLRASLLSVLRSLEPPDWDRPTVAGAWRVRDIAAHLLDGELRTLAAHRDGHALSDGSEIRHYSDVVALIGRLNAEGVAMGRHLSARLLIDLLGVTGEWMAAFVRSLDPDAPSLFPVAWAGEGESTNRFDTAREYTERWHHEMQIRAAIGERGQGQTLLAEQFAVPLLDTAMHVLPHALRRHVAPEGAALVVTVDGGAWRRCYTVKRDGGGWQLYSGQEAEPMARVAGHADAWWRLLFNALPADDLPRVFRADGSPTMLDAVWAARSVMV